MTDRQDAILTTLDRETGPANTPAFTTPTLQNFSFELERATIGKNKSFRFIY